MKVIIKRLLSILLLAALLLTILPNGAVCAAKEPDYALADAQFEALYRLTSGRKGFCDEDTQLRLALRYLQSAEGIAEGSIRLCDSSVFWQTQDGVTCHFSPRLYERMACSVLSEDSAELEDSMVLQAAETSASTGRDVYLFVPYEGLDSIFSDATYREWASVLAHYTGGSAHVMTRNNATVDALAQALENSAIVLFNGHGNTDTGDMNGKTSYFCLQSGEGITSADYAYDAAAGVSHACYAGRTTSGNMRVYEVDGTAIANHMHKSASENLLWCGCCLSLATQGICKPLLAKGVCVVYGYSQEVSVVGDRLWMEAAMDELTDGQSFGTAINNARYRWGEFDYSYQICKEVGFPASYANDTAAEAAANGDAFPLAVSAQDPYPANPNASRATASNWMLPRLALTLHLSLPDGVKSPDIEAYVFYRGRLPTPAGRPRDESHSYTFVGWCLSSHAAQTGLPSDVYYPGSAFSFGHHEPGNPLSFGDSDATLYGLYSYVDGNLTWYTTQVPDGAYDPYDPSRLFTDMAYGTWYYAAVRDCIAKGLVSGYTDHSFRPQRIVRRSEVVSVLYRAAGSPAVSQDSTFTDVPETAWYADAVAWAVQTGLTKGYGDGTFRPDDPVTRAQLAAFFCRYAEAEGGSTAVLDQFPDGGTVPTWARTSMAWAVENGLIQGNRIQNRNYLQPTVQATRAQFTAILQRYLIN